MEEAKSKIRNYVIFIKDIGFSKEYLKEISSMKCGEFLKYMGEQIYEYYYVSKITDTEKFKDSRFNNIGWNVDKIIKDMEESNKKFTICCYQKELFKRYNKKISKFDEDDLCKMRRYFLYFYKISGYYDKKPRGVVW